MPHSLRFRELRKRLQELRAHMLPASFSPTGQYSDRQLDRTGGYRLLVHAEIESFIEDITFSAATKGVSEWVRTKKVSDCLFCLVSHYHHGFHVAPFDDAAPFPESSRPKAKDAIKDVIDIAIKQYRSIHDANNGIKEENLCRLILPVGVRKDDLDPLWITNLNEYGKIRGDIAHKSLKAQQQIDPSTELQKVESLVVGLAQLDDLVTRAI